MASKKQQSKYTVEILLKLFRAAAEFRNRCVAEGLEDNMGAIHSAERALHLLGPVVVYPGMGHLNSLRHYAKAEFSEKALEAFAAGGKVQIEHVQPHRALTLLAMTKLGLNDQEFTQFIKENFRLVLLTPEETSHLNKVNKSKIDPERLQKAGITIATHEQADKMLSRQTAKDKKLPVKKSRSR